MTSRPGRNVGRTVRPSGRLERVRKTGTSGYKPSVVKKFVRVQDILFLVSYVYLQVLLTRLTPVVKTLCFLKPTIADKNRLVAFHTSLTKKTVFAFEKRTGVWLTLIHLHNYQQTIVSNWLLLNWQQICLNFFEVKPETYHRHCES